MSTRRPRSRSSARTRKPGARRRAALRIRRRRMLRRILISAAIVVAVVGFAVLVPFGLARDPAPVCAADSGTFPEVGIEGWRGEQLENAATIMQTASGLGFGRDGQIIGVMTAMGESGLRNIDYGDWETIGFRNPDGTRTSSIGLFQQQDWWGSVETRMDPAASATLFYTRLGGLEGWQQMAPSHAIHRVQINTDPDYYAQYAADATAVVVALSGPCAA
ncbi:hypothetical protein LTA6_002269 [Microbacterium sp. LTA6]|uniref:hypothetical protein n=1 Tax=unclassified Microbacterium TaxID=2609290 RepID=UPI0031387690